MRKINHILSLRSFFQYQSKQFSIRKFKTTFHPLPRSFKRRNIFYFHKLSRNSFGLIILTFPNFFSVRRWLSPDTTSALAVKAQLMNLSSSESITTFSSKEGSINTELNKNPDKTRFLRVAILLMRSFSNTLFISSTISLLVKFKKSPFTRLFNTFAGFPFFDIAADIIIFVSRTTLLFSVCMYLCLYLLRRHLFCLLSHLVKFFNPQIYVNSLHHNSILIQDTDCKNRICRSANLFPYFFGNYYLASFRHFSCFHP